MNANAFLKGFLTGAVVASTAVLLTTPMSGTEMREKLKNSYEESEQFLKELALNIVELRKNLNIIIVSSKEELKPFINSVKQAISSWQDTIMPHQENLKTLLAETKDNLQALETAIANFHER